jgi:hypothetical protein
MRKKSADKSVRREQPNRGLAQLMRPAEVAAGALFAC